MGILLFIKPNEQINSELFPFIRFILFNRITRMQSLLNYYQRPRNQTLQSNQYHSFSLNNSRVVRFKKPQSKLSFLKKLFANNIKSDQQNQSPYQIQTKSQEQENQRHQNFKKSNIIVNSSKFIDERKIQQNYSDYYGRKIAERPDHMIQRYKDTYDRIQRNKHLEEKRNKSENQRKLKQKLSEDQKLKRITKNKFKVEKQLAKKQLKEKKTLNQITRNIFKHSQNLQSQSAQNSAILQEQLRQLKKIDKMLKMIKTQIIKNRSVIIQGVKQLKKYHAKNDQNINCTISLFNNDADLSQNLSLAKQRKTHNLPLQNLTKKCIKSLGRQASSKPIVEYQHHGRIRY